MRSGNASTIGGNVGSMIQSENGIWRVMPYLMPETVNEYGDRQPHGKFVIAYSRDGWYVLDNENFKVLRWFSQEQDAINYRQTLLKGEDE